MKWFSRFSNCTSVLCYYTLRRKDLMCFWSSFTQTSLSVWVWVCEIYNSVVSDLPYIAIDREYVSSFRLHSWCVCQISLALSSIEHENQLAKFYNPGTTHVQHIYPLVRHKQVRSWLRFTLAALVTHRFHFAINRGKHVFEFSFSKRHILTSVRFNKVKRLSL